MNDIKQRYYDLNEKLAKTLNERDEWRALCERLAERVRSFGPPSDIGKSALAAYEKLKAK